MHNYSRNSRGRSAIQPAAADLEESPEDPSDELEDGELLEESELAAPEESELAASEELLDELSLSVTFFFVPVLKSVSYQPSPFNRKAAADTNFVSSGVLHSGQIFRGSSEIF
ncbi:uncharacterized protein METZ01_LOCUS334048 [marine metagenome]|uniref:Uncharacterized protein n=1 Tax=marine metagenome TaxID=408172 RepID=A0A382Q6H0_9ZZZZ